MPSNHLILCRPLLLLPLIFPSIMVFSNESALHIRWPKYWCFSINPSNEYSGLISLRIDWFDLLAVQGTLESLLQHHSSKASILWHSAFFMVQLSYPHMTTRKTIALTRWTFVSKVMSLLFNTLSRLVIAFLPRSKHFLISWLWSPSTAFGAQENKVCHCFHCFPIHLPWNDGTRYLILVFWMLCFKLVLGHVVTVFEALYPLIFQSSYIILQSHQQCMTASVSSHLCQHLLLSAFFIMAMLLLLLLSHFSRVWLCATP